MAPRGLNALPEVTEPPLGTVPARPMELCPGTVPAGAPWLSLLLLAMLSVPSLPKSLPASYGDTEEPQEGTGLIRCGEYSNQVLPNGRCRIVATLPQGDEQRCPDMFRCTDEVSYWLHENEERKQQILELRELISELQEELRNHRHRIKVLELQVKGLLLSSGPVPPSHTPCGACRDGAEDDGEMLSIALTTGGLSIKPLLLCWLGSLPGLIFLSVSCKPSGFIPVGGGRPSPAPLSLPGMGWGRSPLTHFGVRDDVLGSQAVAGNALRKSQRERWPPPPCLPRSLLFLSLFPLSPGQLFHP